MTAKQFFLAYLCGWVLAAIVLVAYAPPGHGLHAFIALNLVATFFNVVGMVVTMATGWAPWRDGR